VARPYIGVLLQDVTDRLAQYLGLDEPKGSLIADVVSGSPQKKRACSAEM